MHSKDSSGHRSRQRVNDAKAIIMIIIIIIIMIIIIIIIIIIIMIIFRVFNHAHCWPSLTRNVGKHKR